MEERFNHHFWHFEISQFLTFEDWYSHQYHKLLGSKRFITNLIHFFIGKILIYHNIFKGDLKYST